MDKQLIKKSLEHLRPIYGDDAADRLNHAYTVYLLVGLALTIIGKSYVGKPLQCWMPAQFKDHWGDFSQDYCFIENTYYIQMNSSLPEKSARKSKEIVYYQWVPFILLAMAVCFYLPRAVWKIFSIQSGLTLSDLMISARRTAKAMPSPKNLVKGFSYHLNRKSKDQHGSFLSRLYLVTKLLYVLNVFGQFFFLNNALAPEYTFWGFGILNDMLQGRHWQESGHFPRVTFCDVEVRALEVIHTWTLQCVLMIFIFLWFWFLVVLVASCVSLITWLGRYSHSSQINFVKELLEVNTKGEIEMEKFYASVLHRDGVFMLRLLNDNCGSILSAEIAQELYDTFTKRFPDKDL